MSLGQSGVIASQAAATGIIAHRIIRTTAGSYNLTGTDVTFRRGKKLSAGVGTFLLTGTAVSIIHPKSISAGSGVFVLTGTAVTLNLGARLIAGAGSFVLNGTAASIIFGRKISAGAGSFTLTGTAATFIHPSWQSTYSQTLNANASGFNGTNLHMYIDHTGLSLNGTQIRVTIDAASSGEGFHTADCFIQQDGGGAGPTRITFDSGSNSVTVPVNTIKVSDAISFALDKTKNVYVSFYPDDSSNDDFRQNFSSPGVQTRFTKVAANDAANPASTSGYSSAAVACIVSQIEVFV